MSSHKGHHHNRANDKHKRRKKKHKKDHQIESDHGKDLVRTNGKFSDDLDLIVDEKNKNKMKSTIKDETLESRLNISEPSSSKALTTHKWTDPLEGLPTPSFLKTLHTRNGTNIRGFQLYFESSSVDESLSGSSESSKKSESPIFSVLYIILALLIILAAIIVGILFAKKYYSTSNKDNVVVVRSLKNEREESRRKSECCKSEKLFKIPGSGTPVTLNSESNLQTVKVKTLAITVRNKLEEEGTEV